MPKKEYYVWYPRDFANEYCLYYTETPEDKMALPEGAERITRKRAEELARAESERRKYGRNSGFAGERIYPTNYRKWNPDAYYREGRLVLPR